MTVAPLPPRARLLHIGIPKTGTTALQQAAAAQREVLLSHGVRYPGQRGNHREPVAALMQRHLGWRRGGSTPGRREWQALLAEIEADPDRRILLSHEFAAEADDATVRRFRDELGPRLHVVVTLRPLAALLPSAWQQHVKSGYRRPFDAWLRRVLADPPDLSTTPAFHRRNDQSAIVARWAAVVGPERVTVVVGDKARPRLLTDAFEDLLGLPRGLLHGAVEGGMRANRSLSAPEAELLRRVNAVIAGQEVDWRDYRALVRLGAVARLLERRTPAAGEARLSLPEWASARAAELGRAHAEAIGRAGVAVIGDLAALGEGAGPADGPAQRPPAEGGGAPGPVQVPLDAAAELVAGMLSAATGRGAFFQASGTKAVDPRTARLAGSALGRRLLVAERRSAVVATPDLLAVLALRGWARLRHPRGGGPAA